MVVPVGKIGLLLVDAQAGERLRVTSPGVAVPVSLFDPRNHPLPMPTVGADASQSGRLAQSGTYLIVVDATSTTPEVLASGLTVTVVKDVETAAIADGEPVTMRLTEPGQHGRVQFAAVAGDTVIAVGGAANIYAGSTLLDPFGIRVVFGTSTGIVVPVTKLDATGVYTLDLDAQGGVGEITVPGVDCPPGHDCFDPAGREPRDADGGPAGSGGPRHLRGYRWRSCEPRCRDPRRVLHDQPPRSRRAWNGRESIWL